MRTDLKRDLLIVAALTVFCVAVRWMELAPGFAPVASAALFAAYACRDRRVALAVPLLGMLVSDMLLGFYALPVLASVYAMTAMPLALGRWTGRGNTALRVGAFSLGHAVAYFLVTNFAVWAVAGYYPTTGSGLVSCYEAGLPFFRYTLASNVLFAALFYGTHALLARRADTGVSPMPASA